MVVRIQRWSPDSCGCVIEQQVEYHDTLVAEDGGPVVIGGPKFLMMNSVCEKHITLASTTHREDHPVLSANVLSLIEQAKKDNLKQVDDLLARPYLRRKTRKELEKCRKLVIEFNANLDEEWTELVEPPHAFDSHIHDTIHVEQAQMRKEDK